MALKLAYCPANNMKRIFHTLPFLFFATIWHGCMPTQTKQLNPLPSSEIPANWEFPNKIPTVGPDGSEQSFVFLPHGTYVIMAVGHETATDGARRTAARDGRALR